MEKWKIELPNLKKKTYETIGWLIVLLHLFTFLYRGFGGTEGIRGLPLVAAGGLAVCMIYARVSKRNTGDRNKIAVAFFIIINTWIAAGYFLFAGINLLLYIFQDISSRKMVVRFFDDRIIYPSFPKRNMNWGELSNVILKDCILTIDHKNNKIYQNEIMTEINEPAFNEFCNERLSASNN